MTTTDRGHIPGSSRVDVDIPAGWAATSERFPTAADPDLVLRGLHPGAQVPPMLAVVVQEGVTDLDALTAHVWSDISHRHPTAVLTSSDVWPHPVWGDGRLVQTARVDDGVTLAHDWYLFRSGDQVVRIEVHCALADLLELEDDIAAVVARLRPKAS